MEDALEKFPQAAEVRVAASLRALARGQRTQAEQILEQGLRQPVREPRYWMNLAGAAQEVWPLADPSAREVHQQQVNAFLSKALTLARQQEDSATELEVAQFYLLNNQLEAAREVCQHMVQTTGNVTARKMLFRLHQALGEPDAALETLRELVKEVPADVDQMRLLAAELETRRVYDEAADCLESAIQMGGGSVEDYQKLVNFRLGLGQTDRALTLLARATRLYPDMPGFWVQEAFAYREKGQLDRAIESFAKADALQQSAGMQSFGHLFYYRYGVTLEAAGRHDEAARQLEKSITLTPEENVEDAANTMNYLGFMWLEQNRNLEKAGELIENANRLQPDVSAFVDSLGWYYFKVGRFEEALKELRRAEALLQAPEAEDSEIVEHIGLVLEAMGRRQEAAATLQRAQALNPDDSALGERVKKALKRLQEPGEKEAGPPPGKAKTQP
ncbi:MAG: tetratricopeptide repeat protein, partial [Verrucomicrobiales bacterium]|nr:tetratricopeptide repeat protein [Verrucomicrobiales bacterium]